MEKLKGLLGKLDGLKSVLGLLGIVAYYALPNFGVNVPEVVLKVSSGLAGVGLLHKLEKGTALFSKVLDVAGKVLEVAKKTEEKLKEGEKK